MVVSVEVDGITKYWDEKNEVWTPERELPDEEVWEQFESSQQKAWIEMYNQFKKVHDIEII